MKKYLPVFIFAIPLCAQVFPAVQDAYVSQYDPSGNYGTVGDISIYSNLFSYNCICRGLVQFDLSSIPPGTTLQLGLLNIYHFFQAGTDYDVEVHNVLQPWLETTLTWDNQPAYDTGIAAVLPWQGWGWWHFDITDLAQLWVNNPGLNHGAILRFAIEQYPDSLGRVAQFYSRDTTLEQPHLEIITASVQENQSRTSGMVSLHPNPARRSALLTVFQANEASCGLYLYDLAGRRIAIVHQGLLTAGSHDFKICCTDLSPGVYIIRIESGKSFLSKPFVVVH